MARVAEILAGRYELLDVIGRGGMGVVYRARDRVLDRTVAVKVLPAEYAEDVTLVERFTREARAAARLSNQHIVAVFDSGRDGDLRYIVMECVRGVSLARLLQERGALRVPEAVELAAQIATALAAAHAAGIVHRDVKPANVMVEPPGAAKVLDFGIAHAAADHALTRTTIVLGSAPYMAPEVALGGSADERSDIYSLGCVLYEMLTGRPPFVGDLPAAVMNQQATVAPQPAGTLEPAVPAALDELLMGMLAKEPSERPQHTLDLAPMLRASLDEAPTLVAPVRPPPTIESDTSPSGRPLRTAAMLAAALLVLAIGVAVALAGSSGSGHPGTASTRGGQGTRTTSASSTTSAPTQTPSSSASSTPSASSTASTTSTTPATSSTTTSSPSTGTSAGPTTSTTSTAGTASP